MAHESPDHRVLLHRVNRMIGQLEGIRRMIQEQQYCPDILTQTKAVNAALRSLESQILEQHIGHCVKHAFESGKGREEKVSELIEIFKNRLR